MTAKIPGTRKRPQMYVGTPPIPDDWPPSRKNQVAVRNSCWVEGECSHCGARPEFAAHPEFGLVSITFLHGPSCPVTELLEDR